MKKHRIDDVPPTRPCVAPSPAKRRRRRRSPARPVTGAFAVISRPRTGAVAIIGIGLLLLVGTVQVVAPRDSESGAGEVAYALWSNPVPSFLALSGPGTASATRGLISADPPRALGVPDASAAIRKPQVRADSVPIRVYFSRHPASDGSFTAVSPVKRTAADRGVAAAALAELIDGPTTEERAAGYFSELGRSLSGPSTCDGRDFRLSIGDGVATVRFCRSMTSAGIGQDARARAQIEATLTQFSTIRSVRLLGQDGHCLFDASGQDRCLARTSAAPQSANAPISR